MSSTPLVCDMNVFTPAERDNHVQSTVELYRTVQDIREVENGFEFLFPNTTQLTKLAEFISNEKMCCPFLEFTLRIEPDEKPISLTLAGPKGTQEFLREEFSEAFA
ncbi:MAG: hypothetical protein L0287_14590 [Anaerolineae bacterium]|nr:hypothetical protein [Anaerolineae bacterium]